MSTVSAMLQSHPKGPSGTGQETLARGIEVLVECAQTCTACADACLGEDAVADLTRCITTDLDCADICGATAKVLSRRTGFDANLTKALLAACATACESCADECAKHSSHHEHCAICERVCGRCREICAELLDVVG